MKQRQVFDFLFVLTSLENGDVWPIVSGNGWPLDTLLPGWFSPVFSAMPRFPRLQTGCHGNDSDIALALFPRFLIK